MSASSRLEVDRYGVPQYRGDPEAFEEYQERAWDLYHGREGSEQLQLATAVHLRSGLQGAAYEAVRKLSHDKLKTRDSDGKVTDAGVKLLLGTLKEVIGAEAPVKTNELFLTAFYSPTVWRQTGETMQQYIVRREQDFARLEEVLEGAKVPDHLRAFMLLCFGGLEQREQMAILSSVGNEYDFKKLSQALRIQFPNASGKPTVRKDLLGCSRFPQGTVQRTRQVAAASKGKGRGRPYVYVVHDEYNDEDAEGDAYFEEPDDLDDAEPWHDLEGDDPGNIEALIQDYDLEGDQELADAFATIMQKKKKPQPSKGQKGQSKGYPFKAHGEISFDQKAKDARKNAVQFLKQVTPCTSCGQRGHWSGDSECPNSKKKGGKPTGAPPLRKKPSTGVPKKKPAGSFYVAAGVPEILAYDEAPQFFVETADSEGTNYPDGLDDAANFHVEHAKPRDPDGGATKDGTKKLFSNEHEFFPEGKAQDQEEQVYMALRVPDLCSHSSCKGGNERKYHRSANGHTRGIHCKEPECERAVISARRKEPAELWSFLVQVALCTLWGTKSRSRALFARVSQVRSEALEEEERERQLRPQPPQAGPASRQPAGYPTSLAPWTVIPEVPAAPSGPPRARILRPERNNPRAWVYGVCVGPDLDLPTFPELPAEDSDILIPLPGDGTLCGNETPFCGSTFETVASSKDRFWYRSEERTHDPRGVPPGFLLVWKAEAPEGSHHADARHTGSSKPVFDGDNKILTGPGGHGPIAPRHRLRARL